MTWRNSHSNPRRTSRRRSEGLTFFNIAPSAERELAREAASKMTSYESSLTDALIAKSIFISPDGNLYAKISTQHERMAHDAGYDAETLGKIGFMRVYIYSGGTSGAEIFTRPTSAQIEALEDIDVRLPKNTWHIDAYKWVGKLKWGTDVFTSIENLKHQKPTHKSGDEAAYQRALESRHHEPTEACE